MTQGNGSARPAAGDRLRERWVADNEPTPPSQPRTKSYDGIPTDQELLEQVDAAHKRANSGGGPLIEAIQSALAHHGAQCACGNHGLKVDGDFGPSTQSALRDFQRQQGLEPDGVPGPRTQAALGLVPQPQQAPSGDAQAVGAQERSSQAPLLSNPQHPDNALYNQALKGLEQLPPTTFKSAQERENAAATIAFEAKVSGLDKIDHVVALKDTGSLLAVQGGLEDPAHKRIAVDQQQASQQPVQKSSELAQQLGQQVPAPSEDRQREVSARGPSMS